MTDKDTNSFRDRVATVNEGGSRQWVYAQKPKGTLYNYRQIVGYSLLALFLIGPFIKIKGEALLLFNVLGRKFVIFGQVFQPQDFHLFVLAMLCFIVFIVLFTVVYGRVWCGWACPQTVFMELVFRRIEFLIEGNRGKQLIAQKQSISFSQVGRSILKHLIFYSIALLLTSYFLFYIIGYERFFEIKSAGISGNAASYFTFFVFSIVVYGVFAFLREQACTLICPYGRLQGAMLDVNSLVVAYDYKRGETRGNFRKSEDRRALGKGDCVDCGSCVTVCPTGIDIRNGTQLECVNCTACIDACNSVMTRLKLTKGLIRFASEKGIETGELFRVTPRIVFYSGVLIGLLILFTSLVFLRTDVETTILRTPGTLFQELDDNKISNLYNVKVVNKTARNHQIEFRLKDPSGEVRMIGNNIVVEKNEIGEGVFFVILPRSVLQNQQMDILIEVLSDGVVIKEITSSFIGPLD